MKNLDVQNNEVNAVLALTEEELLHVSGAGFDLAMLVAVSSNIAPPPPPPQK